MLLFNILSEIDKLYDPPPKNIYLFYKEFQPIYNEMLEGNLVTQLFEGVPAYSELRKILYEARKDGHSLAIFDDARESFATLDPIFTVG